MKLPNSYGSVTKLSGKRRKPYMARVTIDCIYDEDKGDYVQRRKVLGYYATKSEALDALAAYNQNPYSLVDANMSMEMLWNTIKDDVKVSDDRRKVYIRLFSQYFDPIAKMKVKDVKTIHLQKIIDNCDKGYSTKSNIRALLHQLYKYAVQNDLVQKDYADFISFETEAAQIERLVYTHEEIEELWKKSELKEYAITLVLIHQGMRLKEFRDLRKEDVDYSAMTIHIQKGKNQWAKRTIPIHPKALPLLKQLERSDGSYTDMSAKSYEYFCNNVLKHTAYDVRHTFATKAVELNIPTVRIQKIMGHKPDTILEQIYTHLSIDDLAEVMAQMIF